jgi:hypothetical protein
MHLMHLDHTTSMFPARSGTRELVTVTEAMSCLPFCCCSGLLHAGGAAAPAQSCGPADLVTDVTAVVQLH